MYHGPSSTPTSGLIGLTSGRSAAAAKRLSVCIGLLAGLSFQLLVDVVNEQSKHIARVEITILVPKIAADGQDQLLIEQHEFHWISLHVTFVRRRAPPLYPYREHII